MLFVAQFLSRVCVRVKADLFSTRMIVFLMGLLATADPLDLRIHTSESKNY